MDVLRDLDTVRLSEDRHYLDILDQTQLPGRISVLKIGELSDIWEAIKSLRVRGAPAIGVCAGYALAIAGAQLAETEALLRADKLNLSSSGSDCCNIHEKAAGDNKAAYDKAADKGAEADGSAEDGSLCSSLLVDGFIAELDKKRQYLASARPTAVNLSWALNRVMQKAREAAAAGRTVSEIVELMYREADAIRAEDIAISRSIGEIGYKLLKPGCGILTHCNAGTLATAKYGTATAPMYIAAEHGMRDFRVYCDETRPLLQGARLTAFEMMNAGFDTTLICDNMASYMMKSGRIDIIFVGCDRVARNGDAANKIGTSGVAVLAKYYGIPFYVCAPSSTIDMSISSGDEIPIELRAPEEVTDMWYSERMAPQGVKVMNPAFDVTDHSLITGIITEKGLCTAPYEDAFRKLGFK